MTTEFDVHDESGQVQVRWYDGKFDEVAVRPGWNNHLSIDELEAAVATTLLKADEETKLSGDAEVPERVGLERVVEPGQLGLTPEQILKLMSDMTVLKNRAMAEAQRFAANPPVSLGPARLQPSGRNVELVVSGTQVLGVRFDRSWAENASASALSNAITSAVKTYLADPTEVPLTTTTEFQGIRAELDELISQAGMRRIDANQEKP